MTGAAPTGYRPHLDGLRAVAVYLVVLFHAGIGPLAGGFIGVDLFFVLSGYLVTGVLLRDREAHGRVRVLRFYARRVRRLLPAALVVLLVTAAAYAATASAVQVAEARGSVVAAALYVANWHFVAQATDYFAADVAGSPVLHTWSLNVEEQYYLLWPLALTAGWRLLGGRRRSGAALAAVVAAVALASVAWAWSLRVDDLARAYYGTDTRAYQLLAGAALALVPGLGARLGRTAATTWAGVAGLGLVVVAATSAVDVDPVERGVIAAVGSLAAIAGLDLGPRGLPQAVMGWAPIAALGRISYGTYLWHWPVIVIWREVGRPPSATVLAVVTAVVASLLAALSHVLLEQPIRTSRALDRVPGRVVAAGVAASVLAATLVLPGLLTTHRAATVGAVVAAVGAVVAGALVWAGRRPADARPPGRVRVGLAGLLVAAAVGGLVPAAQAKHRELADRPDGLDWEAARDDRIEPLSCTADAFDECVVVDGDGPTVLLMGDSQGLMYVPMVAEAAEELGFRFVAATMPACPWFVGVDAVMFAPRCHEEKQDWYGPVLERFDPDVVLLAHRRFDDPADLRMILNFGDGAVASPADDTWAELVEARTLESLDLLAAPGRRIAILEGVPGTPEREDPMACLSDGGDPLECHFTDSGLGHEVRFQRELAAGRDDLWTIAMDELVCPALPRCDAVVDGMVVWRSPYHITRTFAASLGPAFARILLDEGILGPDVAD